MRAGFRSLATLLSAVAVATCSDAPNGLHSGPSPATQVGRIGIAPVFSRKAQVIAHSAADFGLTYDHVHLVVRGTPDTTVIVKDTTIEFTPESENVTLDVAVPVVIDGQKFNAGLDYVSETSGVLYHGSLIVTSYRPGREAPPQDEMTIEYVGPGADVAQLTITPETTTVIGTAAAALTVTAVDDQGASVAVPPLIWSTSDASVVTVVGSGDKVSAQGLNVRGSALVSVTSPSGASDTSTIAVGLPPASIAVVSGDAQTGVVHTALATPAVVQVSAVDGIGVPGITVVFGAPDGGAVSVASVVTDADGRASTTLTLGTLAGAQSFAASAEGFSTAIRATANAGAASALALVSGAAQADTIGKALTPLSVRAADAFDNVIANATVSWTRVRGSGTLAHETSTTDANGVATNSYTLGTVAGSDSVAVSIENGPTTGFAFTTKPGNAAAIASVSGMDQTAAVGAALTPFVAKVTDAGGNAVQGVTVTWTATNGTLTATTTTGADGQTSNTMTLGGALGAAGATASIGPNKEVTFAATAIAGGGAQLVFTAQPAGAANNVTLAPITVRVNDAFGNPVTASTPVTIALGANPTGATLSGTLTRNTVDGTATFDDLKVDRAGVAFTLVASSGGIATATSSAFTITSVGSPRLLLIPASPTSFTKQAGESIANAPSVQVVDENGAPIPNAPIRFVITLDGTQVGDVTLNADANGTLSTATVPTPDNVGVYTLVATSTAAAGSSVSVTLTVTPGAASVLAFTAPAGVTSYAAATGAVIAPPLTVAIRDAFGNKVPSATNTVSVALTAPNGATLGGTTSVAAVNGVATFSNLSIDLAHIGYTLTATSATLGSATSLPINILGAGDAQLAFGTMANGVAGDAIGPAITVEVQDAQGQKITSSTAPVTLVIASGPGGASISGTTTVTALSGVASFGDIVFTKAGSYSLTATTTASNTAPATSATFTVVAGAPEKISIVAGDEQTAPVNTATPVPPQVLVTDDFDNPVAGAEVRLTIMSGGGSFTVMPGGDNATSGPANTDANGVLTLAAWTLGPNAGENILRARLDDADVEVSFIAHATSGGGSAGPATQLAFTTQPTDAISGVAIPIVVALRDQSGNPATGTNAVTLALASNPAGGSLAGTTTVNAVDGIATFSNVSIRKAGTGYTLTASATDLTSATSNAFDIAVGAATAIGKALPAHGVADNGDNQTGDAGTTLPKPFIVHVTDGFNSVPGATVTWTPGNGTLAAVTTTTDANGLTSNTMTLGGTLGTQAASAEARLGGNSVTFHANVTGSPGVPTQLAVTSQPGNTTTGATLSPVTIVVRDQFGNAVSGAVSVTIALTTPGTATLGGTTTRTTSGGTVTFNDLAVDKPNIYSLTATSTGLASAVTNSFVITGPATKLAISAGDNVSGVAGQATTPPPKVLVTDDGGNPVAGAQVTFSVVSGGGTITPANGIVTSDANGFAALTEWKLGAAAGDQTVQAALSTGTPVVFTAHAASGTAAAIEAVSGTGQTAAVGAALTAFVVKVTDANGLAVEGATVDWTATNGTIAATSHTAADGTSSLVMTLGQTPGPASATASISGVGSVTFNATATVGPPAKLELTSQPTNTTSATVITPAVVVAVRDQFGNATTATSSVTVAIASNPSGGVLSGTTTVAAVNGIAMFSDLSIDKAGMGYTLVLSATGLTSVTTTAFNITAGAPAHLAIASGDNTTGIVGGATADQASVTVTDASDNLVSGATVTFVASGDGSTTPANGQVTTGANGVATLPTWTLGTTAGAQTLTATVNALSVTFHATASSAAANGITTVSGGGQTGTVGTAVSSPLIVHVTDNGGNSVAGARVVWTATNGSVTSPSFTDATGNASTTLTLGGTAGTNATSVTATIDNGQNVSFTASATAGAPHHLAIAQQPTQTAAATAISPSVTVTLRDSFNNITTGTNAVTVALGANPGGGTLSGTLTRNVSGNTATFDDLSIQKAGVGYTLVATSPGLASATTDAFTIVAGAAANIAIVQGDNGGGQVGMASSPTPQVRVTDANGNNVEGATVTYTVLSGGGSTTPPNGAVTSDANGLATLSSWILGPTIGTNTLEARLDATHAVTFTATGSSLAVATIAIVSGNNQSAVVNQAFSPFVVHVEDANGNPVEGARVDWTLTGSGALSANPSTTDATGNASTTLTLGATAGPVSATAKVSNGQQVTFTGTAQPSSAAVVAFTSQPSNTVAGATMAPVVVAVRDFFGNTVTTSSAAVTLTIGTNPGSGTLGGTVTRNAVNGVATFSDLSINRVGTGYTLSAASTGLTSATSDAFAITVGAPAQIDILAGNGLAAVVNENTATPPKVKVSDANGNVVPNASVNFVVTGGGGTIILTADGARVTSGTVTTDASGIATIDSWTMGSTIGTNTLEARVSSLTASFSAVASSAAPNAIAIVSGNDNQSGTVATALAIPFAVKVTDALGNPVDGAAVTWTATNGTIAASTTTTSDGTTSARLTLGTAAGASSATATIANGQNVRFDATALAGPAASLTFTSQPSNTTAEVTLPAITVALHDVYGNATPGTNTVTLALGTNPTGETLNGTVSVAAVNGVATFNNVQVSGAGAGFTLLASATGLTSATSHAFNVASNIVSTVTATNGDGQSGTVNTAAGNALVVSVKDASNSAIQAASISWTARHGTVLSASETFTDTNGETSITIDYSTVAGTDTITATSINGKSASFVVTALPGAPVKLAFLVPSGTANYSGTPSAPIVVPTTLQVAVQDVFGNTVTTSTAPISLSLNGGVGAQLLNAPTTNATAGVANFDQAKIDKVGNYTVTATSSGLTSATSITINISFGAVGGVEFITKTGTGTAGVAVTPAIQVKVTDSDGNLVLAPVPVTLSISFRSQGAGTMTGTLTVNSSNGIATFSDIAFTEAATYRMKADASASGFSFITSGNFVISP